ncbi:MAG: hypothetical protein AB7G34_10635 [Hyphomicrobiales bacterium]
MDEGPPWLILAGLGAFHGLNPAMGWLFAVALGLHRQSRTVVMVSLLPIAIGHAASIAAVAGLLVAAGALVPHDLVRTGAGATLLAWAAYHWRFGHRHRVRFGMQVGLWGLAVWSFLMATAHGAGLMLWPALMQTCLGGSGASTASASPLTSALAGVGIHTITMLATTAAIAVIVYACLGVAVLRSTWVNFDLLWVAALAVTGALLIADVF